MQVTYKGKKLISGCLTRQEKIVTFLRWWLWNCVKLVKQKNLQLKCYENLKMHFMFAIWHYEKSSTLLSLNCDKINIRHMRGCSQILWEGFWFEYYFQWHRGPKIQFKFLLKSQKSLIYIFSFKLAIWNKTWIKGNNTCSVFS